MCAPYVEARPEGGARAEKEIGEKVYKISRYQIVSTYFLHGAFKVFVFGLKTCLQPSFGLISCALVLSLNTLKTFAHYMLCGDKKQKWRTFGLFRTADREKIMDQHKKNLTIKVKGIKNRTFKCYLNTFSVKLSSNVRSSFFN